MFYSLFLKNKTKQNKVKPKANIPSTKNNRKWIAKAFSGDDYYESLWENVIGTQPWNWIPFSNFIGTYWVWQFDERIVDYLEALPSLIGSSLIKSIYWVLVTTSDTVRRKEKNLICYLPSRRGRKGEIHERHSSFYSLNQDLVLTYFFTAKEREYKLL